MNDSVVYDSSSLESDTDSLTTSEEYLSQIEYNTHMTYVGVNYIYVLLILVLTFVSVFCLFKHWFFDGI